MRPLSHRLATFTVLQLLGTALLADATAARTYLQEARQLIESRDFDKANTKLELAEAELEDVKGAEKGALAAQIKDAQSRMAQTRSAADKPKYLRQLRNLMDDAESGIGNLVTWPGTERQLTELFADTTAQAAVPEELAAAAKKFATYKKLHSRKAASAIGAQLEGEVEGAEKEWAEHKPLFSDPNASPNSKESAIERTGRYVDNARKHLLQMPPEDETTRKLAARLDAVSSEFTRLALADRAKDVAERLQRNLDSYADDFAGWEKEAAKPGPTWDAYTRQSSASMSAFFAPKTKEFRDRAESFLNNLADNTEYQSVASAPAVKAVVDRVRTQLATATATLLQRIQPVVAAAEKATVKDPNELDRLQSNVRLALGASTSESLALMSRLKGKADAHVAATTGAETAKVQLIETLRTKAEAVWPDLYKDIPYVTEINLGKVGQSIGFLADNLMGYRFKPGDFYYATTLGGHPVAAKIDPALMAGIKATEEKIGRSLGDDDGDGKWDIIAIVTNQKTRLLAKRTSEATGTIGGLDVKLTGEYAEPVDAVIIEIIAAKCGPFAGARGRGVLKPDGTVGK